MRVLLSWSGDRSRQVAEALRFWLPSVIQAIEPWMSSTDIDKGSRWSVDVAARLGDTRFGIICLTPENLTAPWILFEAGALSKSLDETFVCPYLFDLEPSDIAGPLAQFQATRARRDDTRALLQTLNCALGDQALPSDRLDDAFQVWWEKLESRLAAVVKPEVDVTSRRPDREVLDEVLSLLRNLTRTQAVGDPSQAGPHLIGGLSTFDEAILRHFALYGVQDWSDMANRLGVNEGFLRGRVRTIMTALRAYSPESAVQEALARGLITIPELTNESKSADDSAT